MNGFYAHVVSTPDPLRAVRAMTDHGLVDLIEELRRVKTPNEFQGRVFAMAMSEAVLRWKQSLVSVDREDDQKEGVQGLSDSGVEEAAPITPKIYQASEI